MSWTDKEVEIAGEVYFKTHPFAYKYLDFNGCLNMLSKSTLKFTNPSEFNDPYDCYLGLIKFNEFPEKYSNALFQSKMIGLNRIERRKKIRDKKIKKDIKSELTISHYNALDDIKSTHGVSCFSEKGNKLLMWSMYSDSHKGVCVGFDFGKLWFELWQVHKKNIGPGTVIYTDNFEPVDYYPDTNYALSIWMRTKSKDWEYEEEVRITLINNEFKDEKYIMVPFCKESIIKILIGSKMSKDERNIIIDICKEKYPTAGIYEMQLDKNSFKLNPLLIST